MEGKPTAATPFTTLVTTRLESDVADALARVARREDRSMSAELRRAVRFYLEHLAEATAA